MNKIVIRGHDFDLGVFDLDETKRRAELEAALGGKLGALDLANNPTYEGMVQVYEELVLFFDGVLGAGSLDVILDGKHDVADALDAYYDLRDALLEASIARATQIAMRAKLPEKYRLDRVRK